MAAGFEYLDVETVEWVIESTEASIRTYLAVMRGGATIEAGEIAKLWADYKALTELRSLLVTKEG